MTVTVIYCVITWISYNCQVHIVLYLWTTEKSQPHLKTNKNDIQHAIIHHKDKKKSMDEHMFEPCLQQDLKNFLHYQQ